MKRILSVLLLAVCATIVYAKEPQQPTSYNYQRGVEAVNNDNDEEGEKYLTKEINENPKNGYAYAWLSSIETRKNELGNAINMLNRALQYLPKNDKYYRAWSYSSLATIYIQLEDTITALNYINKAIKTEPKNTDWWNKRGVIYLYTQQYDLALNDFQKVIDLNPGMVTGYIMTGEVYFEQKRYQEALDMYQFALFLAERSYIYAYMAKAENQLQHYEQAADYLITAFELQHLQEDAADLISQENPELLDELIPRLKIQIAKNPNSIEWKYYLLAIHREHKQMEKAIDVLNQIKALDAEPYYDYLLADLYQEFGDFNKALEYAQLAFQSDSTDISYQNMLIGIYHELNRFEDAILVANQMIEQNPDEMHAYSRRADTYFEMQDYEKATEDYSMAIAINSSYPYIRFKRAYSYLLLGDSTKANKDLERLVQEADNEIEQVYALIHLGQSQLARTKLDSILLADSIYHYERYNAACCYALLGDTELAFSTLEEELQDGYTRFNHLRRDIDFRSIQGERFDSLIAKYEQIVQQRIQAYNNTTAADSIKEERVVEIPFTKANGVTKVDCTINNLPLNFVFDTGASDVTISQVEANFMYKNGYLTDKDIIGQQLYQTADGSVSVGTTFLIKEIKFGGLVLRDVRASVVDSQNAPLLLGQTVLQRLGKIEIDYAQRILKITTKQ